MTKVIAVVGATGSQGGSVARTFLKIPGWEVRGITRNRNSAAARELAELGVKIVEADLDDVASVESAFSGASAIFGVTDFWQFVQSPKTHELAKSENITWNEACFRLELQQGINIIDAAVKVAKDCVLERLVLSTLSDAKRASKGKYTWVYHYDGKAQFVQYLEMKAQSEPEYRQLLETTSYVQMGFYLDNWKMTPLFAPQKQANGSYVWYMVHGKSPIEHEHPLPVVHPPTDTGPFVEALVLKAPPGTTVLGTSKLFKFSEFVKLWGGILKVEAGIQELSIEDLDAKFPGGFGREVGESAAYVREYGWDGGEGAILPEQAGVDLGALTDAETYIRDTDWSSVVN
ncbi:putative hscarg dehydrogenase [Exophiala viscosa]|uniref:putative hscarg dehydrogenase n=1 Tax=Exophiala viscosa TaxID=2486360 RepID=UPI002197156C|nr:putative hscarg dehydrogenase [Exophiala viscosa]